MILHSVLFNALSLLCITDILVFHRICRLTILVKIQLHFHTSACLTSTVSDIQIWARVRVLSSSLGIPFLSTPATIMMTTMLNANFTTICFLETSECISGSNAHSAKSGDCTGDSDNVNLVCEIWHMVKTMSDRDMSRHIMQQYNKSQ